jgi:hypothetical protein
MSTFIDLLRQHHQALENQYSVKLTPDMRHAILPCFHVKLPSKENPYGLVHLVSIMIAKRFLVAIEIAHDVSKVQRQRGLKDKTITTFTC